MTKRNLVTLVIAMFFTLTSIAQPQTPRLVESDPSASDIINLINMSKEANAEKNGIMNPDLIYPGQMLTFKFTNGIVKNMIVEKGNSQWKIVEQVLKAEEVNGPVVPFNKDTSSSLKNKLEKINPDVFLWLFFLFALLTSILGVVILTRKKIAKQNPITSGAPMHPNGVLQEQAEACMQQVAERQFGPNIPVRNIEKGRISGENLEVFYAGSIQPKRRTFKDVEGYRGVVTVKNADQYVYFLQACGNDVRVGNYYSGKNIQFIADLPIGPPVIENANEERQEQIQEEQQAAKQAEQMTNSSVDSEKEMAFITSLTEKLCTKDNAKLNVEIGPRVKIQIEFSKGDHPKTTSGLNGASKIDEHKEQSVS